ncbi:MAG: hydroxyacid dehydrogenase [Clostridia bacterium]|nr:hydroxyacid dehydrogenase [Clostridia bacterium]
MKIVVLDKDTLGEDIDLSAMAAVGELSVYGNTAPEQVQERLRDADVAVLNKIKLHEKNLTDTSVRLICVAATGYDNIDTDYCRRAGIALCNVPGYSTDSVAQLTLAMALNLATHIPEYTEYVNDGRYTASGVANKLTPVFHELAGKTWGVVGGGGIGRRVARLAQAFGCRVLMCRRGEETEFEAADIDRLCRESDILSLHCPLTDQTRGMLGRERIAALKEGAIVVNTARGAVTDEAALAQAVKEGKIALGCDVYSIEPFGESHPFYELRGLPQVCLTPHMAWGAYEARMRCVGEIAKNIESFYKKEERNRIV